MYDIMEFIGAGIMLVSLIVTIGSAVRESSRATDRVFKLAWFGAMVGFVVMAIPVWITV